MVTPTPHYRLLRDMRHLPNKTSPTEPNHTTKPDTNFHKITTTTPKVVTSPRLPGLLQETFPEHSATTPLSNGVKTMGRPQAQTMVLLLLLLAITTTLDRPGLPIRITTLISHKTKFLLGQFHDAVGDEVETIRKSNANLSRVRVSRAK